METMGCTGRLSSCEALLGTAIAHLLCATGYFVVLCIVVEIDLSSPFVSPLLVHLTLHELRLPTAVSALTSYFSRGHLVLFKQGTVLQSLVTIRLFRSAWRLVSWGV